MWWVGEGTAPEHHVTVGFVNKEGERFAVTRSRERGCDQTRSDFEIADAQDLSALRLRI